MPVKRERHPDMNLNDLDYSITYDICKNFDIDGSWEVLGNKSLKCSPLVDNDIHKTTIVYIAVISICHKIAKSVSLN